VDFFDDEKIQFVSAKYGELGEIITIKLMCRIYRNGYCIKWGEDEALLFSSKIGDNITYDLVISVVNELLKRNFFNKKVFGEFKILTSNGFQKRFLEATRRRKKVEMIKEFILADILDYNVDIIGYNGDRSTQSKVKESKVKKSKYMDTVFLFENEHQKLKDLVGDEINQWLERLNNYKMSTGKKYKSDYHTILNWYRKENPDGKPGDDKGISESFWADMDENDT